MVDKILAVVAKDIKSEFRTRYAINAIIMFAVVTVIAVSFNDTFHGLLIDGATVTYTIDGVQFLMPENATHHYTATIDTGDYYTDKPVTVSIRASKATFSTSTTVITLVVLTLPSEMIIIDPDTAVITVSRGDNVSIAVRLNDTTNNVYIPNQYVSSAYIWFQGHTFFMDYDVFSNCWNGTINGTDTILTPAAYDVRLTAIIDNYDPAVTQFKIVIQQTTTKLTPISTEPGFDSDNPRLEAVYSEVILFNVTFTAPALDYNISDATVYFYLGLMCFVVFIGVCDGMGSG